jgi:glycosyltransferase involved in cell wall biosynthesis
MRILFLAAHPQGESPSQRYRFEHYLPKLTELGFQWDYAPFISMAGWRVLYSPGHLLQKATAVIAGFLRRILLMFTVWKYDFIYVHREAAPLGPPVFEWIMARLFRKRIIYDFDDAIWVPSVSKQNRIAKYLKCAWKVPAICKMSYRVSVGNAYLGQFAQQYCPRICVIPTVVDTDRVHSRMQNHHTDDLVIGWTGTFSTLKYLDIVAPILAKLQKEFQFTFLVISNVDPKMTLERYRFIRWAKSTEVDDLLRMHVGLMPLHDGTIELGKCGFKAIQYMALGIPAVVSPVGVNAEIVEHGVNGYVATSDEDWENSLRSLIVDEKRRERMGVNSREKIVENYSVKSSEPLFLSLFQ